jgi:cell fate (sporulation/competence/biofilm development) regulator YlbF (YheA/YmcA/DUF963 family)
MELVEAAKELGRLIAQTPEYKNYSQAAKNVEDDRETSQLLERLKVFEQKAQELESGGEEVTEELKSEYTGYVENVQSHPKIQALLVSQDNYLKMMNRVNALIGEGIREGAQSKIITSF